MQYLDFNLFRPIQSKDYWHSNTAQFCSTTDHQFTQTLQVHTTFF